MGSLVCKGIPPMSKAQTANAIAATKRYAAQRAVENPAKLEKAARIVATGLAFGRLAVDDLVDDARKVAALRPPMSPEQRATILAVFESAVRGEEAAA